MEIVSSKITLTQLKKMAANKFGTLVKAVIDVEKNIMAIDADLHADQEALLLSEGSLQKNLWGINLYPEMYPEKDWIEFDSMINLRPSQGNKTRSVDDENIQDRIRDIVYKLIKN